MLFGESFQHFLLPYLFSVSNFL